MVLTRKLDIRMLNMQRQGEMGTFAPGIGQEATQIGQVYPLSGAGLVCAFLPLVWSPALARLGDRSAHALVGRILSRDSPRHRASTICHFSIVIGSHLLPAVGVAQGIQYKSKPPYDIMLGNFGDGAMSQGAVNEAVQLRRGEQGSDRVCL
jgi:TPP-dependent pyruvate/acetoin dehydrogenase alpha subunit